MLGAHSDTLVLVHVISLRWQTGYWARSIEQESLGPLVGYVREQRVRHAAATTLAAWEQHEATFVPTAQDEDA